jgi:hypothetical protein
MSNTYEIRVFNTKDGKQNCFSVRSFGTIKSAAKFFNRRVENTQTLRAKLADQGLPSSALADEIQLVAYNEAMTWLEEIKTWKAA